MSSPMQERRRSVHNVISPLNSVTSFESYGSSSHDRGLSGLLDPSSRAGSGGISPTAHRPYSSSMGSSPQATRTPSFDEPSDMHTYRSAAESAASAAQAQKIVWPNPWPVADKDLSGKVVAIYTSGGDAPGMNAAVRSAAAVLLTLGVEVYAIKDGYKGLVEGGESIFKITWADLTNILRKGGTSIGSARCQEFRERAGRLRGAENLVKRGINSLVAIGGDGSLTGAQRFKTEWPDLLTELAKEGRITEAEAASSAYLAVVGMVGSIDNDMCGFSMTIGCDSALHRIVEAIDALATTAASHGRTFVVEVMGRNCGYLAIMASLACGADFVLVPESPPDCEDWETALCESLKRRRQIKPWSLIILAEGATDRVRRPITSEYVKKLVTRRLGHDTRITCLGHVQRGGSPSAYDRLLATRSGAEAALALLNADKETPARIVGVRWNQMVQVPLTEAVEQTRRVGMELDRRDFQAVMELRGAAFKQMLDIYLRTRYFNPSKPENMPYRVLLCHVGSPAAAMNAAAKVIVQELLNKGHVVLGAKEGFRGLCRGEIEEIHFDDVLGWESEGGAFLGTNRSTPSVIHDGMERCNQQLIDHDVHGLVLVGGFEAFTALCELSAGRVRYEAMRIPMALVPATISNNVPGTDFSLGSDTALNAVVDGIDRLKQSGSSSRRRVFIVETMGSYSGYLAAMGALAGGADAAYTHEEGVRIDRLAKDIKHVRRKFKEFPTSVVLVRNENCSENYSTQFMKSLFEEEGKPDPRFPEQEDFSVRTNILGHLLQGGAPSPLDRVRATRLASGAVSYILREMVRRTKDGSVRSMEGESICVIGIRDTHEAATPVDQLLSQTDFHFRVPRQNWWEHSRSLIRVLEHSRQADDAIYQGCSIVVTVDRVESTRDPNVTE